MNPTLTPDSMEEIDLLERPANSVAVLDHGYVSLVDTFGTDDDIAEAARLSYGRGTKKINKNEGLIRYLYSHHHTSPFEMVEMKFQIRLPIFVMRQWIRHRTANLNEYSGRYSIMPRVWYVPQTADIKGQHSTNKQASDGALEFTEATTVQSIIDRISAETFDQYEELLNMGVSREMARIILPLNMYTEIVWKMDLNNMLKFLWLRDDSYAQPEIQAYAKVISDFVAEKFPMTYAAYRQSRESITLTRDELLALITNDSSKLSRSQTAKHENLQQYIQQWMTADLVN